MPWNLYGAITRDSVRFASDERANRWLVALYPDGDPPSWTVRLHGIGDSADRLDPVTEQLPKFPGLVLPGPVCGWLRGAGSGYVTITTSDGQRATLGGYDHRR